VYHFNGLSQSPPPPSPSQQQLNCAGATTNVLRAAAVAATLLLSRNGATFSKHCSQLFQQQQHQQQPDLVANGRTHSNSSKVKIFAKKFKISIITNKKNSFFHLLLSRIDALEASLKTIFFILTSSFSLRDMAARVIQNHFRAFLCEEIQNPLGSSRACFDQICFQLS
ncbi:hypothetical protein CUMW_144420, partial [Citrus unshiu]